MNALYGTQPAPVKTGHQEYPKMLRKPGEAPLTVNSKDDEDAAIARGFSTKPLAVAAHVGSPPPMTTQPATQSAYDALFKERAEITDTFNKKYAELSFQHEELKGKYDELKSEYASVVSSNSGYKSAYKAAKEKLDALTQAKSAEVTQVEAQITSSDEADEPEAENLFQSLKASESDAKSA